MHVAEGDKVEASQPLVVVEAMKTKNICARRSPRRSIR
ncbi:biotin/lipoyl-containing protein, partial [Rhizorhapis sp. SPR117]